MVDIGNPEFEHQIAAVDNTLKQLGLDEKSRLLVFNKEDRMDPVIVKDLCRRYDAISISAIRPETLPGLVSELEERLFPSPAAPLPQAT